MKKFEANNMNFIFDAVFNAAGLKHRSQVRSGHRSGHRSQVRSQVRSGQQEEYFSAKEIHYFQFEANAIRERICNNARHCLL